MPDTGIEGEKAGAPVNPVTILAPVKPSLAARTREWFETLGAGGTMLIRGVLPLALGSVGALELFGPNVLSQIDMSKDWASALFSASVGYYGFPLVQGGLRPPEKGHDHVQR